MQSQLGTDLITVLVTLVIGRLIVQVTLGRPPYAPAESPSDEVDTSDQVTIWPIDQTSNWPPEVAVDGGSFDRFSRFDGVD